MFLSRLTLNFSSSSSLSCCLVFLFIIIKALTLIPNPKSVEEFNSLSANTMKIVGYYRTSKVQGENQNDKNIRFENKIVKSLSC